MSSGIETAGQGRLFADLPAAGGDEIFETLFSRPGCRIERIVSHGHASAPGHWYDQQTDEWVALLRGAAVLRFADGEQVRLTAGDWIAIPAHRRHRVESTSGDALWLAVHCDAAG